MLKTFRIFSYLAKSRNGVQVQIFKYFHPAIQSLPKTKQCSYQHIRFFTSELPESARVTNDSQSAQSTYGDVDVEAVTNGDPELEKLLKILILEVDIFRQDGQLVPNKITNSEWQELLELKSRSGRLRYLTFLFKNERKEENRKKKIEQKKQERDEKGKEVLESGHIRYGFGGNTMFIRIYDTTMDQYMNKGLINAALYSQHIVIDCSYDQHMRNFEAKNCAKQLCFLFAENRFHPQPFHIQFCNADPDSLTMKAFERHIPKMYEPSYPLFITEKSYLDLYPKEKLVYLTPHCRNDLEDWNHDDIYIIGAMVDKSNQKPLSLAKAKEEGLRMAKLPLERHLVWGSGATKNLTLNQMMCILLDKRHTGDWEQAFRHIPRRKIVSEEELANEGKKWGQQRPTLRKINKPKDVFLSENMIKKMKPKVDFSKLYD